MHFAFIDPMNANTYGHENLDPLGKQASTISLVRDIGKRYGKWVEVRSCDMFSKMQEKTQRNICEMVRFGDNWKS